MKQSNSTKSILGITALVFGGYSIWVALSERYKSYPYESFPLFLQDLIGSFPLFLQDLIEQLNSFLPSVNWTLIAVSAVFAVIGISLILYLSLYLTVIIFSFYETKVEKSDVMKNQGSAIYKLGGYILFGKVTGIIMVGFVGWSAWALIQELLSMLWLVIIFLVLAIIFGVRNPFILKTYELAPDARVVGFPFPMAFLEPESEGSNLWIDFPVGGFSNIPYWILVFLSAGFCGLWIYTLFVA
jgi:hypothetical protein